MYRIVTPNSTHLYGVEVSFRDEAGSIKVDTIEVEANNRSIAAKKAESDGFTVRSVNMIG